MEDPTRELPPLTIELPGYDPIAEIRDIRAWRAADSPIPSEQRRMQK
jgi:hypothetical protein